jgi:hypothetical protein
MRDTLGERLPFAPIPFREASHDPEAAGRLRLEVRADGLNL